jgi:hypothetical protein
MLGRRQKTRAITETMGPNSRVIRPFPPYNGLTNQFHPRGLGP